MIASWQAPLSDRSFSEELLVSFDQSRDRRVLILPALFEEANKLRRFTTQTMRTLNDRGIDSFLPDLPGCNESLIALDTVSLTDWKRAAGAAAVAFKATHVLALRAGALIAPDGLPGWRYSPQTGAKLLRGMLRARAIAAREAGREENSGTLLEHGREHGLLLGGWSIGGEMLCDLETAEPTTNPGQRAIEQSELGGAGLWLRAEPGENQAQSEALASIVSDSAVSAP